MILKKVIRFSGKVICESGLSVAGLNSDISIGGADSEVIKNPLTDEPYLPGSSLKGRMRSQLERRYGALDRSGNPEPQRACACGKQDCPQCLLFGASRSNWDVKSGPTRLLVRDGALTEDTRRRVAELTAEKRGFLEVKVENVVKRGAGVADNIRSVERVPAGTEFELELLLQIFEGDAEQLLIDRVKEGLRLVELSSLGGSGSRGYGKVRFVYEQTEELLAPVGAAQA